MPEMPPSRWDWERDKARFVADAAATHPRRDHGVPLGPLAQQFATLTYSLLLDADTVGAVLAQLVDAATQTLPGAEMASVTLRSPEGRWHAPVATDALAGELDGLQHRFGEGPCVTAAVDGDTVLAGSHDLVAERRWPRFGPAAAEWTVGAVLSTALEPPSPPGVSGALSLYSCRGDGFGEHEQGAALLLAAHASLALALTHGLITAKAESAHLHKPVDSRDVLGLAKGILLRRQGMSAEAAFELLRGSSRQLSAALVERADTLAGRAAEPDLTVGVPG